MELWLGTPEVPIPCVDVRSVAEAHRAAAFLPHAMGRYIVSASHQETSLSLARILAQRQYSKTVEYPIAQGQTWVPKFLLWLLVPLVPSTGINRQFVANNFHYQFDFDTSKSQEELGLEYLPIAPGVQDMFQQIVDAGVVGPKRWYFRLVHG
jgi:dihydroflavonol-4-reductase